MSEHTDLHGLQTPVPTQVSALSRGRSGLADRFFLGRLRRRRLIREIEARTQRVLLCYVSEGPLIDREDVLHLEALLQAIEPGASITLLLNSPGGDVDVAEKLLHMIRESASPPALQRPGDVEIVVPNWAKSAATIMALGADRVIMSDISELGPIDPQVRVQDSSYSVAAWLTAYQQAEKLCLKHPDNPAFAVTYRSFDPAIIEMLRLAQLRARILAEEIGKRTGLNYTMVAETLMDTRRFPSHGQMIDWRTAEDIGLKNISHMPRTHTVWNMYWRLYLALRQVAGGRKKVFESRHVTRLDRIVRPKEDAD